MTVYEQVDALQAQVAELMRSIEAAQNESKEHIGARKAEAKARAGAGHEATVGNGCRPTASARGGRRIPSGLIPSPDARGAATCPPQAS